MRKTTLTVFFHTIFPSGGERFFVGRVFGAEDGGERMDFYKGRGTFYWVGEGGGAGTKWIFVHKIYDIYLQNE